MYRIRTYNKISQKGLDILDDAGFTAGDSEEQADGIILRSYKLQPEEIGAQVIGIGRAGAGVNNIPVDYCNDRGVVVFNAPGANANGVKELVLSSLFLSSRRITEGINWIKNQAEGDGDIPKIVEKGKSAFAGNEIQGKKLAVIGLGAIGMMVANDACHFGMEVLGYDPYLSPKLAQGMSDKVRKIENLDEILKDADYISIHIPLIETTKGFFNKDLMKKMKPGVKLLNFARGGLVVTKDLFWAFDEGIISRYVTDFPDAELITREEVLPIPHLGASTLESEENCAVMVAEQLRDLLTKGSVKNSVNFPACEMPVSGSHRLAIGSRKNPDIAKQVVSLLGNENIKVGGQVSKQRGDYFWTIIDCESEVSETLVTRIKAIDGVLNTRVISTAS
jgi:D-3-phosphoglycerate dehydrogenase